MLIADASSSYQGSTSHARQSPGASAKLKLFALIPLLLFRIVLSFWQSIFRQGRLSRESVQRAVATSIGGNIPHAIGRQVMQDLAPSTGDTVATVCKNRVVHRAIPVDPGQAYPQAQLHMFLPFQHEADGPSKLSAPNRVLVYFHGGGYIMPASRAHVELAMRAASAAKAQLAFMEYTLAPACRYPGQLAQAVAALKCLLDLSQPSEIILGGDSAGGNLILAILAHVEQPHPDVPVLFTEPTHGPFRAAFCLSPRCANDCSADSYRRNGNKDILGEATMAMFTENWKPAADQVWAAPVLGTEQFWSRAARHAVRLLITAGLDEVYVDDIRKLAFLIGAEAIDGADRQLLLCPGEIHDQAVLDLAVGIDQNCLSSSSLFRWLETL